MIFIIPIILGAAALATAVTGIVAGTDGISKMQEAEKIGKEAQKRYEQERQLVEKELEITQSLAKSMVSFKSRLNLKQLIDSYLSLNALGNKSLKRRSSF